MKFKVGRYEGEWGAWECFDENNTKRRIDLSVHGDLTDEQVNSLEGKTVEIDDFYVFLEIGIGVRIIEDNPAIEN